MRHWFSDGAFRAIVRNAAWLGSGSVASALLGLLALSCAGRGMSPEMFGALVVIQSYTKAVSDFVKFQTWQFVVQFGAPAFEGQDIQRLRDVISLSLGLDIASGIIAVLGGMLLLPLLSHALGLDAHSFWLALLYCTLIPFMTSSTPTGILRVFDRFDLIAAQQAVKPLLQASGSVLSYACDFGFAGFVITWYVASLTGGILFWWFAARELKRKNILHAFRPKLFKAARQITGAWNFVWTTNFAHTIWAACNSCTTVLIGVIIGPSAAGLFKIAMTVFSATGAPAAMLEKSFYPEVMRLDPCSKRPWLLGLRAAILAGSIGVLVALILFLLGKPLISLVFGHDYLQAYDLIKIMIGAIIVSMLGFPQESLLLMAGRQRDFLMAQALASGVSLVLLVMMSHVFGIKGAAFAWLGGQCLDVLFTLVPTLRAYRKRNLLGCALSKESL